MQWELAIQKLKLGAGSVTMEPQIYNEAAEHFSTMFSLDSVEVYIVRSYHHADDVVLR